MDRAESRTLQAVERTLEILDILLEEGRPLGVTEIAEATGHPTSTVYVHLQTLVEGNYVIKDSKKYQLSFRFLHHGGTIRETIPVYRHGRSVVRDLSAETGELVNLAIEEDGRGVVIFMARGENAAVDLAPVGKYAYLHHPAYGKAILSCFSVDEVDNVIDQWGLKRITDNTIIERDELLRELEAVRDRGYALEYDEGDIGISCIGGAICDVDGNPLGAISVTLPSNKLKNDTVEEEMAQKILNATNVIELKIEHS